MCGINGLIKFNSTKDETLASLELMNHQILHRGPDDDGFFAEETGDKVLGMAMRRLAIIDPKGGKQPIYSNDRQKLIVFNGEIYNYQSLRKELEQKGYHFSTQSDTEVIVNLYDCFGIDCFGMLDGMFGLSIFDKTLNKLFIARDFFGEKPLYYCQNGKDFYWASELKSICKVLDFQPGIDKEALNIYFQLTYIPAPYTIYKEIKKLEANHILEVSPDSLDIKQLEIKQDFKTYPALSLPKATQFVHDLVQQSVASRSIRDSALGTFLSGGVDSSIISLCLSQQADQKIDTFSIGFDKKSFDETKKSRTVAKLINSNHHEFIISEKDLEEKLSEIVLNFDEPFADSSALASYVAANKTKDFVKVALTGDGGDEVFGGYNKYYIGKLNQKYTRLVPAAVHRKINSLGNFLFKTTDDQRGIQLKLKRLLEAINYEGDFYYNIISLGFQSNEIQDLFLSEQYVANSLAYYKNKTGERNKSLSDFREIDRLLSLEGDSLVKVDRTSMLSSFECRTPFLNKEIWNFSNQLPENYLIKAWNKKYILKAAFKQYFPDGFLDKSKQGFGVPVGDWLRTLLKDELLKYTDKDSLEKQQLFNPAYIIPMVNNHINKTTDNTFRVWTFYCFQKWYYNTHQPQNDV